MSILPPGATIGVFSPAGPCQEDDLQRSCELVSSWGYQVRLYPGRSQAREYLAGSDAERLAATRWALSDPELDAAWMARGGYGLTRLLPQLKFANLKPRPVFGFSDGTALLWALYRRGWNHLVHGPVFHQLWKRSDADEMRRFLNEGPGPLGGRYEGEPVEGPLLGGNLCVLASLCGTPEAFYPGEAIVLVEDVGEQPYRLDRYLTQLENSGAFNEILAAAVGELTDCGLEPYRVVVRELERLTDVAMEVEVGHGELNRPFRYGALYRLDSSGLTPVVDDDED